MENKNMETANLVTYKNYSEITGGTVGMCLLKSLDDGSYAIGSRSDINKGFVIVGMNVGDNMWALESWTGTKERLMFAETDSEFWKNKIREAINADGKTATDAAFKTNGVAESPLFGALKELRETYPDAFIPSEDEMKTIRKTLVDNNDIVEFLGVDMGAKHWTSSQYSGTYRCMHTLGMRNGYADYNRKDERFKSIVVVRTR